MVGLDEFTSQSVVGFFLVIFFHGMKNYGCILVITVGFFPPLFHG